MLINTKLCSSDNVEKFNRYIHHLLSYISLANKQRFRAKGNHQHNHPSICAASASYARNVREHLLLISNSSFFLRHGSRPEVFVTCLSSSGTYSSMHAECCALIVHRWHMNMHGLLQEVSVTIKQYSLINCSLWVTAAYWVIRIHPRSAPTFCRTATLGNDVERGLRTSLFRTFSRSNI